MHSHWSRRGLKKGYYGCKEQLLIYKMLLEHYKSKHRNMSMAWIDYRKAFDSVSHDWIMKSLELFKVSPVIVNFLNSNMRNGKTTLFLSHKSGKLKSNPVGIKCGIFQGDSLSPLPFCLTLIRLTAERKACIRYFLSNFYFSPNDSPSKTMKNVFYFI